MGGNVAQGGTAKTLSFKLIETPPVITDDEKNDDDQQRTGNDAQQDPKDRTPVTLLGHDGDKDIESDPCPQEQQDGKQAYQSCRCVIEAVISSTFEDVVIIVVFFLLQRGCIVILQLKLDFE